jgi:hypothetical protein
VEIAEVLNINREKEHNNSIFEGRHFIDARTLIKAFQEVANGMFYFHIPVKEAKAADF